MVPRAFDVTRVVRVFCVGTPGKWYLTTYKSVNAWFVFLISVWHAHPCSNNEKLFFFVFCFYTPPRVYRLTPLTTPPVEKSTMMNLSLQEIILIGNASEQVRGVCVCMVGGGGRGGRAGDPTVTHNIWHVTMTCWRPIGQLKKTIYIYIYIVILCFLFGGVVSS